MQADAKKPSFLADLLDAFRHIFTDKGVLLLLIGAPILYSFFYPWFYAPQVVQRVPVAIVAQDNSDVTRQIIRYASASPRLDVRIVTGNEAEAFAHLRNGDIYGYALLRNDFKRRLLYGLDLAVPVYGHGGYPVLSKQAQFGFSEVLGTVNVGAQMSRLNASGQSPLQAAASSQPLSLQSISLFNPTQGYATFVVPAVALLILQQTLMLGCAVFVATLREKSRAVQAPAQGVKTWLARLCAPMLIGWVMTLYYFGWVFVVHGYPTGGNVIGALLLATIFVPAVIGLGALVGWWTANRERNLQIILFTSLAFAFVGGFSWPIEALPSELQFMRWFVPCAPAMMAALKFNQFGAPLDAVLPELLALSGTALVCWFLFIRFAVATPNPNQKAPD